MLTLHGKAGFAPFSLIALSTFSQRSMIGMFSCTCVRIFSLVSFRILPLRWNFSSSSLSYGIAISY